MVHGCSFEIIGYFTGFSTFWHVLPLERAISTHIVPSGGAGVHVTHIVPSGGAGVHVVHEQLGPGAQATAGWLQTRLAQGRGGQARGHAHHC